MKHRKSMRSGIAAMAALVTWLGAAAAWAVTPTVVWQVAGSTATSNSACLISKSTCLALLCQIFAARSFIEAAIRPVTT
jgi:hypothetical protein